MQYRRLVVGAGLAAALAAVWIAGPHAERAEAQSEAQSDAQSAPEAAPPPADIAAPRLLERLGSYHRPITTTSPLAQRYFDQGMVLSFGFNHDGAVRAFEYAERLDPSCAMCAWGVALALGPNINAPMGPDAGRRAHAAAQRAAARADGASARERAYIKAIGTRYAAEPPEDRSALDRAYALAMREVHRGDPADVDGAVLYAEALMDLMPWDYWTDAAQPREHTAEVLALLEGVLAAQPDHVGANHYYIHAVEEFHPERAVPAADRLGKLAPDAGHLVHMPSHIYWRVGRYDDALEINQRAAAADESYFAWCRSGAFYRAAYYPHNIHFLWAAAATEGRSQIALTAARKLAAKTAEQTDAFPFVEEFQALPLFTLVRFGRWDAVLGEPEPPQSRLYLRGARHYARGLAQVRLGRPEDAQAELAALRAVRAEPATTALVLAGGTASAADLLAIGEVHLVGELAASSGDPKTALKALGNAVERQDALVYMEPPPWYFPTRQALGAVLLERDLAAEAEAVYRDDLAKNPKNGWALFGLGQSLKAQDRSAEAAEVEQQFAEAWARADVELTASRF